MVAGAGCGTQGADTTSSNAATSEERGESVAQAIDQEAGVTFELDANKLRIVVDGSAPASTREILQDKVNVFCGTREELGPHGASARSTTHRLPAGEDEFLVTLSKAPSDEVAFCGIEQQDGSGEIYGFFIPLEELVQTGTG